MAAVIEYAIKSKDESRAGTESAASNLKNVEQQLTQVSRAASLLAGAGALGGLMMVFNRVTSAAADCEKSFLALHPEMNAAAGSAKIFGDAIDSVKVRIGGTINSALSPLRQIFIDMIDPTAQATANLKEFSAQFADIMAKYSSAGQKEMAAYNKALSDQAALEVKLEDATHRRANLTAQLADAQERLRAAASLGSYGQAVQQEVQRQIIQIQANIKATNIEIPGLSSELATLNNWLKENAPGSAKAKQPVVLQVDTAALNRDLGIRAGIMELQNMMGSALDTQTSAISEANSAWVMTAERMNAAADKLSRAAESSSSGGVGWWGVNGTGWNPNGSGSVGLADLGVNTDPTGVMALLGGSVSILASDFEDLGSAGSVLSNVLGAIVSGAGPIAILLAVLQPMIQAFAETIMPALNSVLQPLISILVIMGQTLGQMLVPIIEALSPVVKILGQGFLWLFNNILVPVGNAFYWVFAQLHDAIIDFILVLYHGSGSQLLPDWFIVEYILGGYWGDVGEILHTISEAEFEQAGAGATTTGTTATGTGASYQSAPTYYITIYNTFEAGSVIDSSGTYQSFVRKVWVEGTLLEAARQGA